MATQEDFDTVREPNCTLCPLSQSCRTVCLMGNGNLNARIMLIGEAPGDNEDVKGIPFVGDAGTLLNAILKEFNLRRDEVYVSNVVKCRPPHNRKPHLKELQACRHYIIDEILLVNPSIIITLGATAMQSLLNSKTTFPIGVNRGSVFFLKEEELKHIPVIPTYHPAAIRRNEELLPPCIQDFEKALNILKQGYKVPRPAKYYSGVADKAEYYVIDVETNQLSPFIDSPELLCIGSSVKDRESFCTELLDDEKLKGILTDPDVIKVGHNIKFDYQWLRTNGFKVKGKLYDTRVAAYILNENRPSLGLKELAIEYTDMGRYDENYALALKLVKGDRTKVPAKIRNVYCAKDCDAAHRLLTIFDPMIDEEGLRNIFDLTMGGVKVIADAELFGVHIDQDRWALLSAVFYQDIKKLTNSIIEVTGEKTFNPASTQQLSKFLNGTLGLPILGYTKKGAVQMDKEILTKLLQYDTSGAVQAVLDLRKIKGDYAKYLDLENPPFYPDSRIHASFNVCGTDTGRYSCNNPNLQAITKDSPIRSMFISNFKDGKILQVDYDQGELRILAQESRDKVLLKAFNSSKDIHTVTASEILNIPEEDVTEKQRFEAKTINFGIMYGIGPDKLSKKAGIHLGKAINYIRDYKAKYVGVREYIRDRENQIMEEGEVTSLFGRKRRITILNVDDEGLVSSAKRRAVNAPIQGALHDLNVLSMVKMKKEMTKLGYRSRILMAIHDAVVFDVYPGEEVELRELIKEVFTQPDTSKFGFEFIVPLTVSIKSGDNWKDIK